MVFASEICWVNCLFLSWLQIVWIKAQSGGDCGDRRHGAGAQLSGDALPRVQGGEYRSGAGAAL